MIRILHVVNKMDRAGTETLIMSIYRNIDREKVQFDFAVHSSDGEYEQEIRDLGGRIYRLPSYKVYNYREYKKAWEKLFNENKSEWDIVHGHMRSSASIYLRIASELGMYTVAHSHSVRMPGIRGCMYSVLTRNVRKTADYYFACSEKSLIEAFGKDKLKESNASVVLNGIDTEQFTYDEATARMLRKQFNINDEELVIGNIGRFAEVKNHEFLIDIFEEILKKRVAKLLLVGKGTLQTKIQGIVEQKGLLDEVLFLGQRDDISKILSCMDVVVQPSIYEGLSIAGIEAQSSGAYCFFSDGFPKEAFVSDRVFCVPLSAGAEKWAEKIISTPPPQNRERYSKAIKDAGFDIKQISRNLQEFYILKTNLK